MPKLKTHKSAARRFHSTGTKKLKQRYTHQDHYNSRDNANKTRQKRRDVIISKTNRKHIEKILPYS
ncbi:MAG: hypothetical protein ACD_68C00021G0003 [uncultured bacterium]|nr:MAG: hypothetical protein ACD_68C00021G0003 [uncultured bacterium]